MSSSTWLDLSTMAVGFAFGVTAVHKLTAGSRRRNATTVALRTFSPNLVEPRPQRQLPIRSFDELVQATSTRAILNSLEHRTRFSSSTFSRDCQSVLEAFADFVQMLPASESHHHAQPGGLWVHALEVVDTALALRAGMELPAGASTEERKRLEYRWTYAVFAAALLHDAGKPVTDVKVTLYGADPRDGRPWAPMAGPMRTFGMGWYSVSFADAGERDYKAHAKLPALLLHTFVQQRVMRWLAEDGDVLSQLLAYLSGDDPIGTLGEIVKRADSDSVRRNLLAGPRTRFSSARARPLIERLMEALRRMLQEGAVLPLNRPGAAGWVHDGRVWFVCARLADEVRTYLSQHESLVGVPGKDRNDRLFDTWQEHGAVVAAPDGGAIWRVRVECENWSPPDLFTVLVFPLATLYPDGATRPPSMHGRVWVPGAATSRAPTQGDAILLQPSSAADPSATQAVGISLGTQGQDPPPAATAETPLRQEPAQSTTLLEPAPAASSTNDDLLTPEETAHGDLRQPLATTTPELGSPLRPKERHGQGPRSLGGKEPSPVTRAFMAWVANGVGSGAIKYNEDGAPVHFVAEGALLLTPEIFRRFLGEHAEVPDGPIAALRESHGDRAFARLQNELAKSGWSVRNGDENVHHYAFVKADQQLSRTASFFLIGRPDLFWNPVPAANVRIRQVHRPRKMSLPGDKDGVETADLASGRPA